MKRLLLPFLLLLQIAISQESFSQIDSLIVETYYISDGKDATDEDGGSLGIGSVTYRIYLDLSEGYKLMNIFGTQDLPIYFSSTEGFFNNTDRGELFGFDIGPSKLKDNTTALDTWITLGMASKEHMGINKEFDTDGSIVGGVNNDGGSESIQGGLLVNNNIGAGIPLTTADGLVPNSDTLMKINYFGINDESIFGPRFLKEFEGSELAITSNTGISGTGGLNHVLIAQLTTKGEISLNINVTLQDSFGTDYVYKYDPDFTIGEESFSKWLSYPFKQGCTDPNYLEFDPGAIISDNSCVTDIVFGCMDIAACNYSADANFNIQELCCYSRDNCGGRDVYEVCENYTDIHDETVDDHFTLYPNPAFNVLSLTFSFSQSSLYEIRILDVFGRDLNVRTMQSNQYSADLDVSRIESGVYFLVIRMKDSSFVKRFVKG